MTGRISCACRIALVLRALLDYVVSARLLRRHRGGPKTITAAYRYVPWSGPTAGWH